MIMFVFASLPAHPSFFENLRFQIVGLIIVLIALGLMALVLDSIGRLFKKLEDRKPAAVVSIAPSEKPADFSGEEERQVLLAVIAAAVDSVIDEAHRIISIRPVIDGRVSGDLYLQAWSIEGRRQHFASHKIR